MTQLQGLGVRVLQDSTALSTRTQKTQENPKLRGARDDCSPSLPEACPKPAGKLAFRKPDACINLGLLDPITLEQSPRKLLSKSPTPHTS